MRTAHGQHLAPPAPDWSDEKVPRRTGGRRPSPRRRLAPGPGRTLGKERMTDAEEMGSARFLDGPDNGQMGRIRFSTGHGMRLLENPGGTGAVARERAVEPGRLVLTIWRQHGPQVDPVADTVGEPNCTLFSLNVAEILVRSGKDVPVNAIDRAYHNRRSRLHHPIHLVYRCGHIPGGKPDRPHLAGEPPWLAPPSPSPQLTG